MKSSECLFHSTDLTKTISYLKNCYVIFKVKTIQNSS